MTEVFYKNRVLHVFDDCTVRQCVRAILNSLHLVGAAYLLDDDGHLLPSRKLSSARGDVRFFVLVEQKSQKYVKAITTLSRNTPSENRIMVVFGDDKWNAKTYFTAEKVLKHIIPLCTCSGAFVLYLSDEAGPVAPSLELSSTFGNLSVSLKDDTDVCDCPKYGKLNDALCYSYLL